MKTNVQALRKPGSLSGHLSLRVPLFFTDCSTAKRSKPVSWVCPTFQSSDLCNSSGNATEERDLKGEFFSGLVVRILGFLCHVPGSIPARETEIPQAVLHGQKKKRFKKPTFSPWKPDNNRQRLHSFCSPLRSRGSAKPPAPAPVPPRSPRGPAHTRWAPRFPPPQGQTGAATRPLGAHPAPWSRLEGRLERRRGTRLSGTRGLRRAA